MRQGDQPGSRSEDRLVLFEHDFAAIGHRNDPQHGALLGDHLPGHDVGVVFERGENDLIARLQELAAVSLGNQVDAFRASADKNDFLGRRAPRKAWTFCRACSKASVARAARVCAPRWMFELSCA